MYLGKNTKVTKAAKNIINEFCLKNHQDREDVATALGIKKGTLDNKLKPSMPDNCFTVEETLKLCELTNDDSILKAMCNERGLTVFDPIEAMADGGDIVNALLMGVLEINYLAGKLANESKVASEDGVIDGKEKDLISKLLTALATNQRKIELMLGNDNEQVE